MNRLEMIATFTAMDALHEKKEYDALGRVIRQVLIESCEKSDPITKEAISSPEKSK